MTVPIFVETQTSGMDTSTNSVTKGSTGSSKRLQAWVIAVIVIGAVLFVVVVSIVAAVCLRKGARSNAPVVKGVPLKASVPSKLKGLVRKHVTRKLKGPVRIMVRQREQPAPVYATDDGVYPFILSPTHGGVSSTRGDVHPFTVTPTNR
jgi:hypothetical protein